MCYHMHEYKSLHSMCIATRLYTHERVQMPPIMNTLETSPKVGPEPWEAPCRRGEEGKGISFRLGPRSPDSSPPVTPVSAWMTSGK